MTVEDIYRVHSAAVHAVAVQVCGSALADDVTQDVFLRLWRRPEAFDPVRGTMRAFLVVMVRHVAVDHLRSQGARRAREQRVERFGRDVPAEVDHQLLRHEQATIVAAALNALRGDDRLAISVAFFGGCTYRETAIVLGIPEGTVKTRIRRGLHRLRALLELPTSMLELDVHGVSGDLFSALDGRRAIEQATGVVAECAGLHPGPALAALRAYARDHGEPVVDVAQAVVAGTLEAHALGGPHAASRP